ncbi:MAG: hypothetical protein JKX68_01990 [Flavobacteriales bacterium]|nr:hypothetical protein [Flavobacteriales bacterium]
MKNLKTILTLVAIVGSSFIGKSYAISGIELNEKIEEVVKFKNGVLSLEKNRTDFVKVSFRINKEGRIEILALNYSDEKIKMHLINKLSKIKIEDSHDVEKIYNYNFSFKKI